MENISVFFQAPNITAKKDTVSYGASVTFGLLSAVGLALYIPVWTIIVARYRHFKNNFYMFVIAIGVCDMCNLMVYLFYCVPCIALQKDIYFGSKFVIGFVQSLAWQGQGAYVFFIALNRCIFAACRTYKNYNALCGTTRKIALNLICMFAIAFCLALINELTTCHWLYDFGSFAWAAYCKNTDWAKFMIYTDLAVFTGLPLCGVVLYAVTWILVKKRQNQIASVELAKRLREIRLLVQFSIITVAIFVYVLLYWILPLVLEYRSGSLIVGIVGVVNSFINPVVYLIWDKKIQHSFISVFERKTTVPTQIIIHNPNGVSTKF